MPLPYRIEPFDDLSATLSRPCNLYIHDDSMVHTPLSTYSSDKLLPGPPHRRDPPSNPWQSRFVGARTVERFVCGLVAFAFFSLVSRQVDRAMWQNSFRSLYNPKASSLRKNQVLKFDRPQASLRSNLRADLSYITSFPYAGFTNQLLSTFKLVYVAQMLGREAILPDLEPNHGEGGYARYSDFFDLDYLADRANVGIVEWQDLKTTNLTRSTEVEHLGCWGEATGSLNPLARYSTETPFWPVPIQLRTKFGVEPTVTFPGIQVIDSDNGTVSEWLESKAEEWFGTMNDPPPFPEQHLLCFENLFYTSSVNLSSYEIVEGRKGLQIEVEGLAKDDAVWLRVGQYLRFTPGIDRLVDDLLTSLLGDSHSPFIAVHLRQGDFVDLGRATNDTAEIKSAYSRGLGELRSKLANLATVAGVDIDQLPVLFATDSNDQNLLKQLARLGWILIDHDKLGTREKHGDWYPGLLDSAILSRAVGLVGTKRSTFTYLAERRIASWNGGAAVIVEV